MTGQSDRQRSDSIGRTVLKTVDQKSANVLFNVLANGDRKGLIEFRYMFERQAVAEMGDLLPQ